MVLSSNWTTLWCTEEILGTIPHRNIMDKLTRFNIGLIAVFTRLPLWSGTANTVPGTSDVSQDDSQLLHALDV